MVTKQFLQIPLFSMSWSLSLLESVHFLITEAESVI